MIQLETSARKCRSRQIFEGAEDFFPNSPNLRKKFFCVFCLQSFSRKVHEDVFLVWPPTKSLHVYFCKHWAPFFEIKERWAPFVPWFSGILPGFSTNQNFGGAHSPSAPPPLTPLLWKNQNEFIDVFTIVHQTSTLHIQAVMNNF